ncbi:MAG: hypothetical protein Q8Q23_05245 [bacterium]|nr:hypothetical protein [bacterium]
MARTWQDKLHKLNGTDTWIGEVKLRQRECEIENEQAVKEDIMGVICAVAIAIGGFALVAFIMWII